MPSHVYSSIFQNFIRSGFSKSFTHGYAQSVVAATHPHVLNSHNRPSFSRRHTTRIARLSTLGLQSAFHITSSIPTVPIEHRHERLNSHGGLDAYFEHLQKKDAEEGAEKEWEQFQFPKRIEWNPTSPSVLLGSAPAAVEEEDVLARDGQQSDFSPEEHAGLAHIDAALENEHKVRKQLEAAPEESTSVRAPTPPHHVDPVVSHPATPLPRVRTPARLAPTPTPPVDAQSQTYADHLAKLAEHGRYAEIPAVFEAMLIARVRPVSAAYNALLMAAIQIPSGKIEMVSKALDVYADMLHRNVSPDSDTYNILVGLLAARSLELAVMKKTMEDKRLRYGGMDEPGKFMFASHDLEHAILCEDDRLDLAIRLFELSVLANRAHYSSETYHQLISACAQSGRVSDMLQLFEHMESNRVVPFAATFPAMITAFANAGDLISAVECYNEYKNLAILNDQGSPTLHERLDAQVYAAVLNAYIVSGKTEGAIKFFDKITREYGVRVADIRDAVIRSGFVQGFIDRGIYSEALQWAQSMEEEEARGAAMAHVATVAADHGDNHSAVAAFTQLASPNHVASPTMALLAMNIRDGNLAAASRYWQVLCSPEVQPNSSFIEPTAMYAVAMIGSGHVAQGLTQSDMMFQRLRDVASPARPHVLDEMEEAADFIARFMAARGLTDPRTVKSPATSAAACVIQSTTTSLLPSTTTAVSSYDETYDPYAHNTDLRGSSWIADEVEGAHGRKNSKLNHALMRFRSMRRAGRHPRYITYAKLISAAAREGKMDVCNDILSVARTDVPPVPHYATVRHGWSLILDAMVGACLAQGHREQAEHYHQELLGMGTTVSANTFGLYITSLKGSTKTFDEASEALTIFHRAKAEGVEPTSFLYNALIGKLGKARRIDDCLFYYSEMRSRGIQPTSVTYGTLVNALCRVSDEKLAEDLFDEMEAMANYKARPAPYNSMMQFFLTAKRDKSRVLAYYDRMLARGISPTAHTYKLLVDTHATLAPINMTAAEAVLDQIRSTGARPEPVHYASLIHARGCVLHDMEGARRIFDAVANDVSMPPNACLYQALLEAMVANHRVADTQAILADMRKKRVELTPYMANTLIHGWAAENEIAKASEVYNAVSISRREPSTYEAMTRAYLAVEERDKAKGVLSEMLSRGYPSAVCNKVLELLGGRHADEAEGPGMAV